MTDKQKVKELQKQLSFLHQELKDKGKIIKKQSFQIKNNNYYISELEKQCSDLNDKVNLVKIALSKIELNAKGIREYTHQLEGI